MNDKLISITMFIIMFIVPVVPIALMVIWINPVTVAEKMVMSAIGVSEYFIIMAAWIMYLKVIQKR